MPTYPKRLIEVDLPIRRISAHSRREKSIRHGHISTLHIWWARRPLAACRAVICAALWPDPVDVTEKDVRAARKSNRALQTNVCPPAFRKIAKQEMLAWTTFERQIHLSEESRVRFEAARKEPSLFDDSVELRGALLDFIADFANWDNATVKDFVATARALTQAAHEALGGPAGTHPLIVDPFAGGGAIPLEAMRVGGDAFASDLNPLPVLLNKVALEYVPKYGIRLISQFRESVFALRENLKRGLREFYFSEPESEKRSVFFWGRTIACEGPRCGYRFPLLRSLWLRQKAKRGVAFALRKNPDSREVDIEIVNETAKNFVGVGTSKQGAATCPVCGFTTPVERVRHQLSQRHGGAADAKLLAVGVTKEGQAGKFYRLPTNDELRQFENATSEYNRQRDRSKDGMSVVPNEELNHLRGFFNVVLYGMRAWGDLFNPRQALLMVSIANFIKEEHVRLNRVDPGLSQAVSTCLALVAGKVAQYNSSCCRWKPTGETLVDMFGRQAIPMVWDFAEAYPFSESTGDIGPYAESFCAVLENLMAMQISSGTVEQSTATKHPLPDDSVDAFVTDPPYYDAIPYADLSDFFYVWLRRMLSDVHPQLLGSPLSPKEDECVTLSHRAAMYRNKDRAFFERTMTVATSEGRRITKPSGIGVVVFANKSTAGWEAMLGALIESGWIITGSWPIDTEMSSRLRAQDSAVLASSVHLICRPRKTIVRSGHALEVGDWRDILHELPQRIHEWMPRLAHEGVVGADAIFACLGPALEIYSQYSRVEKASGESVALREYLEHVWAAVAKEALSMVFAGADTASFEPDARITAMWLWTLTGGVPADLSNDKENPEDTEEEETGKKRPKLKGFVMEFDAARKIAQGLGANLENLATVIEMKGDTARLLPVSERAAVLFGKDAGQTPTTEKKKKDKQLKLELFDELMDETHGQKAWNEKAEAKLGETTLDRVHQSMILFAAGRGEAMKRFLVDDGAGKNQRFWGLAQALSALYPASSDEKRWVDGVLARKKGLGL